MLSRLKSTDFPTYVPLLTVLFCALGVVLYIGINFEPEPLTWESYGKWGAPSLADVLSGKYWGLITSNFLHVEIWHIFFNLYWFWLFGKMIEFTDGKIFLVALVLSAALVSSLSEYTFTEGSGIGLSGVVYTMFGYQWIMGRSDGRYKDSLDQRTVYLFIIWLFACLVLTWTDMLNVGNAAHFGGLAWGIILAFVSRYGRLTQFFSWLSMVSLLLILIYRGVFSTAFLSQKAYTLHSESKTSEAVKVYKQILKKDPRNEFALGNLRLIEIDSIQRKAYGFLLENRSNEAKEAYQELLRIDPANKDARDYLRYLSADSAR